MKKTFDRQKQTLTDFNPEEHKVAMMKEIGKGQAVTPPTETAVPKGRSMFRVGNDKLTEVSLSEATRQPLPRPTTGTKHQITNYPAPSSPPPSEQPDTEFDYQPEQPLTNAATRYDVRQEELMVIDGNNPPGDLIVVGEHSPLPPTAQAAATPRSESAAALHARAMQRKPKKEPAPQDMILANFRIPKYLWDEFFKRCRDRGTVPSIVLRNIIKSHCGL